MKRAAVQVVVVNTPAIFDLAPFFDALCALAQRIEAEQRPVTLTQAA